MSSSVRVENLARWTAGYGLGRRREPDVGEMTDSDWSAWAATCMEQRITGLAIQALRAGHLQVPEQDSERLRQGHEQAMIQCLQVEQGLLSLGPTMQNAGIDFIVLKGPAVAHSFYADPSLRSFADLDLLVRGADWERSCSVLEELGYRRRLPEPRKGFDVRFGKAAEYEAEGKPGVDLHRTLVLGPFGLYLDPETLFEGSELFELGGRHLLRLNDTYQLLHACMHAALGWRPPLLVPLRDVVQIPAMGLIDWDHLRHLGERWQLRAVIGYALRAARDALGVVLPSAAEPLTRYEPDRRESRMLAVYTGDRRNRGGLALGAIRAIPGLRLKAAYVRALLVPRREFLQARMGSSRPESYLRRWRVAIRWSRRTH